MRDSPFSERELAAQNIYDPVELEKIEQILLVFDEYIKSSAHFDILWSNKVGYIFFNSTQDLALINADPFHIACGRDLCDRLFYELAVDVMEGIGRTLNIYEANWQERLAVEARLKPYIDQLPEYERLAANIFHRPAELICDE